MRRMGFTKEDFAIRLSNRQLWTQFLQEKSIAEEQGPVFLQIIDKMERVPEPVTDEKLQALGLSLVEVNAFIAGVTEDSPVFAPLRENLRLADCGSS